jgi:hypothetical protein
VVVRTFIHHRILPLRERVHSLWQHQGIVDLMIEFLNPIPDGLFWVLMIEAISVDYRGEGVGPIPSRKEHPPSVGHPLTRMILEAPLLQRRSGSGGPLPEQWRGRRWC